MRLTYRLAVVGILSSMACGLLTPGPLPIPTPRPTLVVEVWPEYPVARVGDRQVLYVRVFDLLGQPANGVNVVAEVISKHGQSSLVFPVTDGNGRAVYQEAVPKADPGTLFEVKVRAFRNLDVGQASTSFTVWP